MQKKFYAVRNGRQTGIFQTWDECRAQVDGFPGARYKSFPTQEAALLWLKEPQPLHALFPAPEGSVQTLPPANQGGTLRRSSGARRTKDAVEPTEPQGDACHVYTDGSCLRNPNGPGGWAVCIVEANAAMRTLSGGHPSTTNNRMEMTAAIEALRHIPKSRPLLLSTDSQYLKNGITKWIHSWKRRGWKKADGAPVLNRELWQELDALITGRSITFQWVKGHAGHKYNEICDTLAKKEAAAFLR